MWNRKWKNLWRKSIDKIYCISLKDKKERQSDVRNEFKTARIRANFHLVEKPPEGGHYGCYKSHMECYADALSEPSMRYVLIFEDDVCFEEPKDEICDELIRILNERRHSDESFVLFLGGCTLSQSYSIHGFLHLKRASFITTTHAYILSRRFGKV